MKALETFTFEKQKDVQRQLYEIISRKGTINSNNTNAGYFPGFKETLDKLDSDMQSLKSDYAFFRDRTSLEVR